MRGYPSILLTLVLSDTPTRPSRDRIGCRRGVSGASAISKKGLKKYLADEGLRLKDVLA